MGLFIYGLVVLYLVYWVFSASGKIISAPKRAAKSIIKNIKDV